MVGSYPPTQTSPLNPTYSQNVLHHKKIDGVDAISRRNQVNPSSLAGGNTTNLGFYIGELDLFEWHHLAMPNILPMEMKERTFSMQNLKYPHSPVDSAQWIESTTTTAATTTSPSPPTRTQSVRHRPVLKRPLSSTHPVSCIEERDLKEKLLTMKEAKMAQKKLNKAEYKATVIIQSKVRQIKETLQYRKAQINLSKQRSRYCQSGQSTINVRVLYQAG